MPDGGRVLVPSGVRHGDGVTLACRTIDTRINEIPEFQPLPDRIDDTEPTGAVAAADASGSGALRCPAHDSR